jgi:hypothetical protein
MIGYTPKKIDHKIYKCHMCKRCHQVTYEYQTPSGNIYRRCWVCLTPAQKTNYQASQLAKPTTCSCGFDIVYIGRGNGVACCGNCRKPKGLCTCPTK